ncbi:testin-like isoform X1 [Montipora foliosa]|uniref:testin-like isoform X1 n=1 Tax=Montipora foliosa TaxID=591990 RepID=UPI0035F18BCD
MSVRQGKSHAGKNMDSFQRILGNDEIKMNSERSSASKKGILLQNLDEGKPCLKCGEKCPGFSLHVWRKVCANCKCPRENHDVSVEVDLDGVEFKVRGLNINKNINNKDALPSPPPLNSSYNEFTAVRVTTSQTTPVDNDVLPSSSPPPPPPSSIASDYIWSPLGLTIGQVDAYMRSLPDDKVPIPDTPGEAYYLTQRLYQNPPQDKAPLHFANIPEPQREAFVQFWNGEDKARGTGKVKVPLGRRETCQSCFKTIPKGDVVVAAEFEDNDEACYHAACFCCSTCFELLVDLSYYKYGNKIYCGRHHAELSRQRCFGCDELIFTGEYTIAMNKSWHLGHFRCNECDVSITGKQFIVKDEKPVCSDCFDRRFANECDLCHGKIGPDCKDVSTADDRHWHEMCFMCDLCRKPLRSDGKFTFYKDQVLCNDCYINNFQKMCEGCHYAIESGSARLEYNGAYWHEECFKCAICHEAIGTSGFVPKDGEFYCPDCYQNQHAKRCAECGEPLSEGGVLYNEQTWHKECFSCYSCHESLAARAFSVHGGLRYCIECYGRYLAKQCELCLKPIIGGEYFTLDDSNFHKECFNCSRCQRSLANEGFAREGVEVLCSSCAD